jgi:hypothetical protein
VPVNKSFLGTDGGTYGTISYYENALFTIVRTIYQNLIYKFYDVLTSESHCFLCSKTYEFLKYFIFGHKLNTRSGDEFQRW